MGLAQKVLFERINTLICLSHVRALCSNYKVASFSVFPGNIEDCCDVCRGGRRGEERQLVVDVFGI